MRLIARTRFRYLSELSEKKLSNMDDLTAIIERDKKGTSASENGSSSQNGSLSSSTGIPALKKERSLTISSDFEMSESQEEEPRGVKREIEDKEDEKVKESEQEKEKEKEKESETEQEKEKEKEDDQKEEDKKEDDQNGKDEVKKEETSGTPPSKRQKKVRV